MRISRKLIAMGDVIPRGYRVAYWDFGRDQAVCLPIGLHWCVMFGRWVWCCSFWYHPTWVEKLRLENQRLLSENLSLIKDLDAYREQERTIGHAIRKELAGRYTARVEDSP